MAGTRQRLEAHPPRADRRARRLLGRADPGPGARRGGVPRRALPRPSARRRRRPRPAEPHAAGGRRADPRRVLRGGRRHRDDEHLHGDDDRPGRLRARGRRPRDERRGRAARPPRRRRWTARRPTAALRRRLGRARSTSRSRCRRASTSPSYRARHVRRRSREAYAQQIRALARGRRRLLPDRDGLRHAEREGRDRRRARGARPTLPLWLSFTAVDTSGRNLSGQTVEAFWTSVEHAQPLVVGVNCSLGATRDAAVRRGPLEASRRRGSRATRTPACPNEFGGYDEQPHDTSRVLGEFARDGLVNIVGGCCGTTPEHVRAIVATVEGVPPRRVPEPRRATALQRPRAVRDRRRTRTS